MTHGSCVMIVDMIMIAHMIGDMIANMIANMIMIAWFMILVPRIKSQKSEKFEPSLLGTR